MTVPKPGGMAGGPAAWPAPRLWPALRRGATNRCPVCGGGPLFAGYLRVRSSCRRCGAPLGRIRADDAPPYFTIVIVGHIVVPLMLLVEQESAPALWVMAAAFLPLTLLLCLILLRPVKGATVGLMLRLGITGTESGPGDHRPDHRRDHRRDPG